MLKTGKRSVISEFFNYQLLYRKGSKNFLKTPCGVVLPVNSKGELEQVELHYCSRLSLIGRRLSPSVWLFVVVYRLSQAPGSRSAKEFQEVFFLESPYSISS